MSFLMVGHTHEDVDAFFSKVSTRVKGVEVATLPGMMAEVWESESTHPVPKLITEVADYKKYLKSFKINEIHGQSAPVAFLFSMRNNVPIYQYKASVKQPWIPINGRVLWSQEEENVYRLPRGEPLAKPMENVHMHIKANEVILYIEKYVEYMKRSCRDETSQAYRERYPLIKYWEGVVDQLRGEVGHIRDARPLSYRFWPRTNHGTGYQVNYTGPSSADVRVMDSYPHNIEMTHLQDEDVQEMEGHDEMFVGRLSEKERERWTPLQDIQNGKFVILRPDDEFESKIGKGLFWLVKALGPVDPNHRMEDGPRPMFKIEWWRPKHANHAADDKL